MTTLAIGGIPRVDLMPPTELARRGRARLARGWFWGAFAALLVAVLLVAGAFAIKWLADQQLAAEQARTNSLLIELSSLSEVSGAIATEAELQAFRAESMAGDFAWRPVIDSVTAVLPADVTLGGFELISGGAPQGEDPTLEDGLVGVMRLESPTAIDMPSTVRAMRAVPGISEADGHLVATSLQGVGAYQYEVSVAFDQTIYTGRYATEGE